MMALEPTILISYQCGGDVNIALGRSHAAAGYRYFGVSSVQSAAHQRAVVNTNQIVSSNP